MVLECNSQPANGSWYNKGSHWHQLHFSTYVVSWHISP